MKVRPTVPLARRRFNARLHEGFTLLEVLVAIVILSFGVLGVVGLQAAALQANKEARYQSAAVRLGRELGDLMRGNKDLAIQTSAANNPYLVEFDGTLPTSSADCYAAACISRTAVAQFNIREWLNRVSLELPGARVVVCFDQTPYTGAGVPQWDCTGNGGVAVVKMGWTRASTNRGAAGSASNAAGLERAINPTVVLPLIAGSVE